MNSYKTIKRSYCIVYLNLSDFMALGKKGVSSSLIFLVVLVAVAVLLVLFARQDAYIPQGDVNFDYGVDFNGAFNPIDFGVPANDQVKVNGVETYFCPKDECALQLINKINSSTKSIDMAIYSFTHDDIASALISAKIRGVQVRVIFDYDQSTNTSSDDEKLIAAGINVERRNGSGYMHNKFTVIDGNVVATGSFNYSQNADTKNDENLIFIISAEVASKFSAEFERLWLLAEAS